MIDEAALEAAIDARVQRRLAVDRRYRNAENAEEQAAAERRIELEEELYLLVEANRARMAAGDLPTIAHTSRAEAIARELDELRELDQHPDPLAGRASVRV